MTKNILPKPYVSPNLCSIADCTSHVVGWGLCQKHYRKQKNTGRFCSIEGCGEQYECGGYCKVHYRRWLTHGDPHFVKCVHGKGKTVEERFWSRITKHGQMHPTNPRLGRCWEWQGLQGKRGYGVTLYLDKNRLVHRIAWHLKHGKFPDMMLLHSCDNRICVNTNHLREGDHADNTDDMVSRNRQSKGEHRPNAKLTDADIRAIRAAENVWGVQTELSKQYGVNTGAISRIRRGIIWKHVK